MQKLPPYGKTLDELQSKGTIPADSVYIFVGQKAFAKAQAFQASRPTTMAIKAYECPSQFRWPVKDCDILIFDTGHCEEEYLSDLAFCLYQAGAKIVRCVMPDFSMISYSK